MIHLKVKRLLLCMHHNTWTKMLKTVFSLKEGRKIPEEQSNSKFENKHTTPWLKIQKTNRQNNNNQNQGVNKDSQNQRTFKSTVINKK